MFFRGGRSQIFCSDQFVLHEIVKGNSCALRVSRSDAIYTARRGRSSRSSTCMPILICCGSTLGIFSFHPL